MRQGLSKNDYLYINLLNMVSKPTSRKFKYKDEGLGAIMCVSRKVRHLVQPKGKVGVGSTVSKSIYVVILI